MTNIGKVIEIRTPVVGTTYIKQGYEFCLSLQKGDIVELVPDPKNQYDEDAIKVFVKDTQIGFIPNQGLTCGHCWHAVSTQTFMCNNCSESDNIVSKGLATRIIKQGLLTKNYGAIVDVIKSSSKTAPVIIKLVVVPEN
jgi:hypothetical protein